MLEFKLHCFPSFTNILGTLANSDKISWVFYSNVAFIVIVMLMIKSLIQIHLGLNASILGDIHCMDMHVEP